RRARRARGARSRVVATGDSPDRRGRRHPPGSAATEARQLGLRDVPRAIALSSRGPPSISRGPRGRGRARASPQPRLCGRADRARSRGRSHQHHTERKGGEVNVSNAYDIPPERPASISAPIQRAELTPVGREQDRAARDIRIASKLAERESRWDLAKYRD